MQMEEPTRDEEAYKLFCQAREDQRRVEADKSLTSKQKAEELRLLQELQEDGERESTRLRKQKMDEAKVQVEMEADRKLADEVFRKKLYVNVVAVMEEMKQGLFKDPEGMPYKKPNEQHAMLEAHRRWREEYIKTTLEKIEDDLLYQEAMKKRELEKQARRMERKRLKREAKQKKIAAKLERKQERLKNERLKQLAAERFARLRGALYIKNFDKAVVGEPYHMTQFCEHIKAKAWGNLYGKGLRCVRCGKELTATFDDPNQQAGIGHGESPDLVERVTRHRQNSPGYKFRSGSELAEVEEERMRLEKERRGMKCMESVFYDFEDLQAIYDFDRRHKNFFKLSGIFRQGVQWTERETERWRNQQLEYFNTLTPRTRTKKKLEFEDFMYERAEAPTFRKYDMVRKAFYDEMIYAFSRVNNCRMRITELKSLRVAMTTKRKETGAQADFIHKKLVELEETLRLYEQTLDKTGALIERRNRADREWRNAKELIRTADIDKKVAEMACVGLDDMLAEVEKAYHLRTEEVKTLLRQSIVMDREVIRLSLNIGMIAQRAAELLQELRDEEEKVNTMMYRRKGAKIPTPYGLGTVTYYREDDDMVLLRMPYGKIYMPPIRSLMIDRAIQQAARVEMEYEEKLVRAYYKFEIQARKRELVKMEEEDRVMQAIFKEERLAREEVEVVASAAVEEEQIARLALSTPEGQEIISVKADKVVQEAVQKRTEVGNVVMRITVWPPCACAFPITIISLDARAILLA
jgi:hypothetical protein